MGESEDIRWAVAWTTSREDEAVFVQGYLQSSDIPCIVEDVKFHIQPVNVGDMAEIRLLVPEDRRREARELIERARRGEAEKALGEGGETKGE